MYGVLYVLARLFAFLCRFTFIVFARVTSSDSDEIAQVYNFFSELSHWVTFDGTNRLSPNYLVGHKSLDVADDNDQCLKPVRRLTSPSFIIQQRSRLCPNNNRSSLKWKSLGQLPKRSSYSSQRNDPPSPILEVEPDQEFASTLPYSRSN